VLFPREGDEAVAGRAIAAGVTGYVRREGDGSGADRLRDRVEEVLDRPNGTVETAGDPEAPVSDATGRARYERELRRNTRAMDKAPVGIVITDPDRDDNPIIYANDRFTEITGYPIEEILGRNCRFLQGEDTDPETVATIREAIDAREPVTVVLRNYRADGEPFWNELTIAPIEDAGEVAHYVGFQRDVTERKRRRERLAQRERTLRELHAATREFLTADSEAEVADQIVDSLQTVFEFTYFGVMWFDETEGLLRLAAVSPSLADTFDAPPTVEPGDGPVWDAYRDGEARVVTDLADCGADAYVGDAFRSLLVAPVGDYGVVLVHPPNGEDIDAVTTDMVELLAATVEAVLDRLHRERKLSELSRTLSEREARVEELEGIVDSIQALQDRIAASETRDALEETVCRQLVRTDRIDFAWIGRPETADTDLSATAWSGTDPGYLDTVGTHGTEASLPAQQAASSREVVTVDSVAERVHRADWAKEALSREFRSAVSIPLVHDGVLYGVLTAYSATDGAFDALYENLLEDVAALLGNYIPLFEQRFTADGSLEVELELELADANYPLHALAVETDATIRFDAIAETTDDAVRILVTVTEGDPERVRERATDITNVAAADWFGDADTRQLDLTVAKPFLATEVRKHGARVVASVSDGTTSLLEVTLPRTVSERPLVETLTSQYREIELVAKRQTEREANPPVSNPQELLTERQFEILTAAYHGGYYDTPKGITGEEIAESFGISSPVVYNHLQAAHRRLLEDILRVVTP
jgi:PAS domain S-box-containing protein